MGMARKDMIESATARGNVYGFLAAVFRAEATVSMTQEIQNHGFPETLSALGLPPGDRLYDADPDKLAEDLALEFTKLFIGPGPHLSPYESTNIQGMNKLDATLWGPQTVKKAEAWAKPDEEFAANIVKFEERFLGEHLSQWAPMFCDKVIDQSEHPFYRGFAEVTKDFLEFECQNFTTLAVETHA